MFVFLVHADGLRACLCVTADKGVTGLKVNDLCVAEINGCRRFCTVCAVLLNDDARYTPVAKCRILRAATEEDRARRETNRKLAEAAIKAFDTENAGAPQKPYAISAHFDEPRKHLELLFHADRPFDARRSEASFRRRYSAEVSIRQVGIRDEVAAIGSIGPCGRPVCCARWLDSVGSLNLNVRMAKKQNISLNPSSLNGQCDKLKCCLSFELETDTQPSQEKDVQ